MSMSVLIVVCERQTAVEVWTRNWLLQAIPHFCHRAQSQIDKILKRLLLALPADCPSRERATNRYDTVQARIVLTRRLVWPCNLHKDTFGNCDQVHKINKRIRRTDCFWFTWASTTSRQSGSNTIIWLSLIIKNECKEKKKKPTRGRPTLLQLYTPSAPIHRVVPPSPFFPHQSLSWVLGRSAPTTRASIPSSS